MDLLKIINIKKIHHFYKKVKNGNLSVTVLRFGNLLRGWNLAKSANLQHNISKIMPARETNVSFKINTLVSMNILQ